MHGLDSPHPGDPEGSGGFVTVAVFDDQVNANIAAGRLQTEGIIVRMNDHHLVQMDWLYALTVGGIKLQVAKSDARRALDILSDDYSDCLPDF
jgi:hypothetical protein